MFPLQSFYGLQTIFQKGQIALTMITDVLIVGGGVIGLSIARELHRRGIRKITIVEKGRCGLEASWAAAGMLAPNSETEVVDDFYRLCNESNSMYPGFANCLMGETGIDIELDQNGTLFLGFTEEDEIKLAARIQDQRKAGIDAIELERQEVFEFEPFLSPNVRGGIFYPSDGHVENRKLLAALCVFAESNGIDIVENIAVDSIIIEKGRVVAVSSSEEPFAADVVVLATGAWTSFIKLGPDLCRLPLKPIRGQMQCYPSGEINVHHVVYSPRGYVVPRRDGRILTGATIGDVGFNKLVDPLESVMLKRAATEIIPALSPLTPSGEWAGLRPFAPDGLPVIGKIEGLDGLFVASGHYRNGILLAPITAKLMVKMILDGSNQVFNGAFSPSRFWSKQNVTIN